MKKRNYLSDVEDRSGNAFSVIADFEGNEEQLMDIEVEEVLPILPLRNMVLFPGVFMPVSVGRKSSLKLEPCRMTVVVWSGISSTRTILATVPMVCKSSNRGVSVSATFWHTTAI